VLIIVKRDSGALDEAAMIGLLGAFLVALSTTLLKRLSATEEALTILLYFGLFASLLTAIPAWLVCHQMSGHEIAMLALVGGLSALGQFCSVRAYTAGELMLIAPIDYRRLAFAGTIGFLVFVEVPDRYTLVGAAIVVGSTRILPIGRRISRDFSASRSPQSRSPSARVTWREKWPTNCRRSH
jgi:drug/metabolite transporter (DMT)-like permease